MLQVCKGHCSSTRGCLKELKDKELIDEDEYKQLKAAIIGTVLGS